MKALRDDGGKGPLPPLLDLMGEAAGLEEFPFGAYCIPLGCVGIVADTLLRVARENGFEDNGAIGFKKWLGKCRLMCGTLSRYTL